MRLSEILAAGADRLRNSGIPSPVLDAELLAAHAMGKDRFQLVMDGDIELPPGDVSRINGLLKRRESFEPVAYITGRKEFYSIDFMVDSRVLIPRPETELLVDMAVYYAGLKRSVLDLGTGSGAIAVSVKKQRPDLHVTASDISPEAIEVARKNSEEILGEGEIDFYCGDLFAPLEGRVFDVMASNPPYIGLDKKEGLQKDLEYEPGIALFCGDGGREAVRRIINEAGDHITADGILLMEISFDMEDFIVQSASGSGFGVSILKDYSGLPRVAVMKRKN